MHGSRCLSCFSMNKSTIKLAEAEQKIKELEAHCEFLKYSVAFLVENSDGIYGSHLNGEHASWEQTGLLDDMKKVPKQSLAQHDAAVIRKALDYVQSRQLDQSDVDMMDANLLDYANKLEAGE